MATMILMMTALYKRFLVLPILFCALLWTFPVTAEDGGAESYADLYTVEDVEVDITSENAVMARTEALDEAQISAYKILAGRILGDGALEGEPEPDPLAVGILVQDFEVTNEQLSSVRYKGTFTVRFRPRAVDRHFNYASADDLYGRQEYGEEAIETAGSDYPKTLILPFYQYGRMTTIWDDHNNKWMEAWRRARGHDHLIIPIGDALDLGQLRNDQALTYNYDFLKGMMSRYGATQAMVLIASERMQPDGTITLEVNTYHANQTGPEFSGARTFTSGPEESEKVFAARVVNEIRKTIRPQIQKTVHTQTPPAMQLPSQEGLQPDNRVAPPPLGPVTSYKGRAVFTGAREWVELKKAMQRASGTQNITVKGLKPTAAEIELTFAGDPQRLSQVMAMSGVAVKTVQQTDTLGRVMAQAPAMFEFSRAPGQAGLPAMPNYQ